MNVAQRLVLAVGLMFACAAVLFVPYEALYKSGSTILARSPAGHGFLAGRPSTDACLDAISEVRGGRIEFNRCSMRIDVLRLALQLGAVATLFGALTLVAGLLRKKPPTPSAVSEPTLESLATSPSSASRKVPPAASRSSTFLELLRREMPGLPISGGDLHEQRPLVITEDVDHVSVEYQVMDFIIKGDRQREYRKTGQQLINRNGRRIDVLTYVTKPIGAKEWTGEPVSYYFDITAGFDRMSAQFED